MKPEKSSKLNGIRAHDLRDTRAVLPQLSYQANRELVTLWVRNMPVDGEEYTWIYEISYIWTAEFIYMIFLLIHLFTRDLYLHFCSAKWHWLYLTWLDITKCINTTRVNVTMTVNNSYSLNCTRVSWSSCLKSGWWASMWITQGRAYSGKIECEQAKRKQRKNVTNL